MKIPPECPPAQEARAGRRGGEPGPLQGKVEIETLPVTRAFLPRKRLLEERGELALIEDGMTIHHLGYFSLVPGKGCRGGHFHEKKTEHFYVVSGTLRLEIADPVTGERAEAILREGQKAVVHPGCAHRFRAEKTARVIEYYEGRYDKGDDHPHDFDGEG
jgi:mannose-6-phosphate isomerase-like protein (cupin superfamily)